MAYLLKDYSVPGTAPGTLPATPPEGGASRIFLTSYYHDAVENREITDLGDLEKLASQPANGTVTWVHVIGFGDMNTIRRAGEIFNLHPLALEDVVHRGQRPKVEDYPQHAFAVFQYPTMRTDRVAAIGVIS
ncbi:MAG TPA: hypothetical protein VK138_02390 [Acidiferrobacterales bacterium]|nr:hypothetical protein [Acidiferrobacterales bacterium]